MSCLAGSGLRIVDLARKILPLKSGPGCSKSNFSRKIFPKNLLSDEKTEKIQQSGKFFQFFVDI